MKKKKSKNSQNSALKSQTSGLENKEIWPPVAPKTRSQPVPTRPRAGSRKTLKKPKNDPKTVQNRPGQKL